MKHYVSWLKSIWNAPGNRGGRIQALARAFRWFLRVRFHRPPKVIRLFGGPRFACHDDSYMAKHVHYFSEFADYDPMHFIDDFLREGDWFLDVGANAGLYSLLAARKTGATGGVIAVEPQPRNLEILRQNMTLNPGFPIELHAVAAAESKGELRIGGHDVFAGVSNSSDTIVPSIRLDSCVRGRFIALAKIDVEGYEWPALRGLSETIRDQRLPVVFFEMNGCLERYGMNASDFFSWFRQGGYELAIYEHDKRLLKCLSSPQGDVIAFTPQGATMIHERMPEVKIATQP